MKTIFKVGDKVFDIRYGWGIVKYIYTIDWEKVGPEFLVCEVDFNKEKEPYIYTKKSVTQMLSFTEYTLQGFTQEKPVNYEEYIGKWGKFWDNGENAVIVGKLCDYCQYHTHHFRVRTHDDEVGFYTNFEPLTDEQLKVLNLE